MRLAKYLHRRVLMRACSLLNPVLMLRFLDVGVSALLALYELVDSFRIGSDFRNIYITGS